MEGQIKVRREELRIGLPVDGVDPEIKGRLVHLSCDLMLFDSVFQ